MAEGARVLVIDDDDVAREALLSTLQASGHEVFDLPSAIGATSLMLQHQIDVLVLDIRMPHLSGDKLARMLRNNPRLSHVGIVLVSGCNEEELGSVLGGAGADAFVNKRDIRERLAEAVAEAADKRQAS